MSNSSFPLQLVGGENSFNKWCDPLTNNLDLEAVPTGATSAVVSISTRFSDAPRETFVFIHGRPSSRFTFSGVVRNLTKAPVSCWLLDLPGHGFTQTMPCADNGLVSPQNAARYVLRFMRENGIERAVLVGHSYGGLVACYAAALATNRVSGLVLIDSEGVPRKAEEFTEGDKQIVAFPHCVAGTLGWVPDLLCFFKFHWAKKLFFPWQTQAEDGIRGLSAVSETNQDPALLRERQKEYAAVLRIPENYRSERYLTGRVFPDCCQYDAEAASGYKRVVQAVGEHFQITGKKCLIVWGAADPLFPYRGHGVDVFAEAFNQQTHIATNAFDAGHMPHEVYPERVAQLIKAAFCP